MSAAGEHVRTPRMCVLRPRRRSCHPARAARQLPVVLKRVASLTAGVIVADKRGTQAYPYPHTPARALGLDVDSYPHTLETMMLPYPTPPVSESSMLY